MFISDFFYEIKKGRVSPRKLAKPGGRAARSPPAAHRVFVKKKKKLKVDRNFEIINIMCYCKTFINNTYQHYLIKF